MAPLLGLIVLTAILCLYRIYRATTTSTHTEASVIRGKWDISVHSPDTNRTLIISIDLSDNIGSNTAGGGSGGISITWRPNAPLEAASNVKIPPNTVHAVTTQVQQGGSSSSLVQSPTETMKYNPSSPSSNPKTTERKEDRVDGQGRNQNVTKLAKDARITHPRPPVFRSSLPSQGPIASVKDDSEVNPFDGSPIASPPRKNPIDSIALLPVSTPSAGKEVEVITAAAEKDTVNVSEDPAKWKEIDTTILSVQCPYVSPLTARRCSYESSTGRSVRWVEKEWKHWRCHILDEIHSMSYKTLEIGNGTLITSKQLFEKYRERDVMCDVCHDVLSDKCDLQARVDNLNPNRDYIRVCNFCVVTIELMGCQLKPVDVASV